MVQGMLVMFYFNIFPLTVVLLIEVSNIKNFIYDGIVIWLVAGHKNRDAVEWHKRFELLSHDKYANMHHFHIFLGLNNWVNLVTWESSS